MTTIPDHRQHYIETSPGIRIFVRDFGPVDAPTIIDHHGTPSCSVAFPCGWTSLPKDVRLISFDRPGYGRSDNQPGRRVKDAGQWSESLADHLGVDRFALMGTSGGGPHAAAAAAVLGDRITRLCVSVGLGPVGLPGFDVAAGMPDATVQEINRAREGESSLRAFVNELLTHDNPVEDWLDQLPPWDVEVLSRPDVQAEEKLEAEESAAGGHEGWIEDDLAFFHRGWEVDLSAITADALLLYGAEDVLVPANHGDHYRTAIGHGQVVKVPSAGHWMRDIEPAVVSWLTSDTQPFALEQEARTR